MFRRFCRRNPEILLGVFLGMILGYYTVNKRDGCVEFHDDTNPAKESSQHLAADFLPPPKHLESDDYEPVVLLSNVKISPQEQHAGIPARPRYYSSELGIHETLYVAIASSRNTIRSLGIAINRTSASYLPRLSFFINSISDDMLPAYQNLSMNIIRSSDDSNFLNPILILRFLMENHVDIFDWFFIAPDTTYVRGKDLMEYVKKISVGQLNYVGVPLDKHNPSFCDFNAGILISQAVMKRISEQISVACLIPLDGQPNGIPDTSILIGECVFKLCGLRCNERFHSQIFPSFNLPSTKSLDDQDQAAELVQSTELVRSAVTVYPLSAPAYFYRLHLELNKNRIAEIESLIEELQDDIVKQSPNTPSKGHDLQWPIGVNPQSIPKTRFDVIEWTYLNETHLLRPDDFQVAQKLTGANLKDIEQVIDMAVKNMEERYATIDLKFVKLVNGYRRFDPTRGMEYLLDLDFRTESEDKSANPNGVRKRVRLLKALGKMEPITMPFVTENTRIHVTLTITLPEIYGALKFLKRFADTLLEAQDNVFLMMVLIYGPNDPGKDGPNDIFSPVKQEAKEVEKRFTKTLGTRLGWVSIRNPLSIPPSEFAILDLIAKKFAKDSTILRTTVNGILNADFLNRVRLATISGWQVFFPIPFIEYRPDIVHAAPPYPEDFEVKRQTGHFDRHSTEFAAFSVMDYISARRAVADVWPLVNNDRNLSKEYPRPNQSGLVYSLYTLFLNSDLHVFRGVEPMLKVIYSPLDCDIYKKLDRRELETCDVRLSESFAGKQQLALYLADTARTISPRNDTVQNSHTG